MSGNLSLGYLIEGTVEQDPMTDRFVIRTVDHEGNPITFDPQEALSRLQGQEIRFTLNSIENLARLAQMVEEGGGQVFSVNADEIPGYDVKRKPR